MKGQVDWRSYKIPCAQNDDNKAHICVTPRNFVSFGDIVKKSALTASTLLQCAFDSMLLRVE